MNRRASEPLLDELLQTLRDEQSALVRGDADALPSLADAKARAFDHLSIALRAAPSAARAVLADTLRTAQRINDTNAALISARMAVNRARLDTLLALAGHATGAAVYGARGELPSGVSAAPRASASA
jgi:flagellar biosynthesis/type III secretory pathway chaperone